MSQLINRKTVVVNQSLATSNTFILNLQQKVSFLPKYVIVKQLLYCNIVGTDNGTYLIWSDLCSDYIGAVYMGIQGVSLTPMTNIPITSQHQSITFRVESANPAFTGPSGQLTMVLEFVQE